MPTSSILHEKIELPINCILGNKNPGDYIGPTAGGLIRNRLVNLFGDYHVDTAKSGVKHYSVKLASVVSAFDLCSEYDLSITGISMNIGSNVANTISKQIFNTRAKANRDESFSIENKLYMKDVLFINNNDENDIVLFDLMEIKYKFDFKIVSKNPSVYEVKGEIELLTDENDLRHDFTNTWEMFKHFVTRTTPKQNGNIRNILF